MALLGPPGYDSSGNLDLGYDRRIGAVRIPAAQLPAGYLSSQDIGSLFTYASHQAPTWQASRPTLPTSWTPNAGVTTPFPKSNTPLFLLAAGAVALIFLARRR